MSTIICASYAQSQPQQLLVAAASDLASLRQDLISEFHKVSNSNITFTFGASGQLALQIQQGAPYDLFLSANQEYIDRLASDRFIDSNSVAGFAKGRLGLWAPGRTIKQIQDLLQPQFKHISIANPLHAPYGMAAKQALEAIGVYKKLEGRLVYGENVRQALQFAETGNAEATIASWSLLQAKPGAVLVPLTMHREIRQTLGIVNGSKNEAAAREFASWLLGPKAKVIFTRAGFY